jgi:hypothetical protein
MAAFKIGIGQQFENHKTKYVVYFAFLVFVTILVAYSILLLFQDISILGDLDDQILPSYMSSSSSSSVPSYHSNPLDPTDIEIVYPNSDQSARIESNLEISGISNYDPSSVCSVSVIVNDIKPYKKTIPTGGNKTSEYFSWKYVIEGDSNSIRQGDNRVTARLLCAGENGQDIRKWDSVAVIGQSAKDIESERLKKEALTVPIKIKSISGISSPTIEIDRNLLVELINERIGNSSEDIKDSIRDSILSIYNG